MNIYVSQSQYEQLKAKAVSERRPVANMLAIILEDALSHKTKLVDEFSSVPEQASKPRGGLLPCCKGSAPCKHWQWDIATGEGYIHSITGETRAVQQ